jgi:hypothetical protein
MVFACVGAENLLIIFYYIAKWQENYGECDLYPIRSPFGYACKGGTGVRLLVRSRG